MQGGERDERSRDTGSWRRRLYAGLAIIGACLLIASAIDGVRDPFEPPPVCQAEPDARECDEPAPVWAKLVAAGGLLIIGGAWLVQDRVGVEDGTAPPLAFLDALMPWGGFIGGMGRWARMLPRHRSEHPDDKHPRHGDHWPPR